MQIHAARELAAVVRSRRKELGWSQTLLAEEAGVGRDWIIGFEQGKASVELGLVLRTLKALRLAIHLERVDDISGDDGINLGDLLGETRHSSES